MIENDSVFKKIIVGGLSLSIVLIGINTVNLTHLEKECKIIQTEISKTNNLIEEMRSEIQIQNQNTEKDLVRNFLSGMVVEIEDMSFGLNIVEDKEKEVVVELTGDVKNVLNTKNQILIDVQDIQSKDKLEENIAFAMTPILSDFYYSKLGVGEIGDFETSVSIYNDSINKDITMLDIEIPSKNFKVSLVISLDIATKSISFKQILQ